MKIAVLSALLALVSAPVSCNERQDSVAHPMIVARYSVPGASDFFSMTIGSDGALWFANQGVSSIFNCSIR